VSPLISGFIAFLLTSVLKLVLFAVVASQSWLDFYKGKSIIADNRVLTQVTGQQFSQFIQIILFRETGKQ
jgi:hypothetical protein